MSRDAVVALAPKSWSFEPTGRLVHLRWAVAEIGINQFMLKPLDPMRLDELLARAAR